jgi:Phage gp6-like head-tail connector protein
MHSILEILDEATDSAGPDLISLTDLKLALGITDDTEDATLQAAITFQSRIIAEYCDRRFGRAEALETFTFDPGEYMLTRQALTLSLYPVAEILEISSVGATAADYQLDPASGRVWGGWSGTVAVVYSGGYDLPEEAPARLQKAVIEAVRESQTSGARDPSIREVQHGDTRISYFTSSTSSASPGFLSAPVVDLIRPYRRLHVA